MMQRPSPGRNILDIDSAARFRPRSALHRQLLRQLVWMIRHDDAQFHLQRIQHALWQRDE